MRSRLVVFLSLAACGSAVKPSAPPPSETATVAPEPTGDLGARAFALLTKMARIVDEDQSDCAKMAVDLREYATNNRAALEQLTLEADRLKAGESAEIEARYAERTRDVTERMKPGIARCAENPDVQRALESMPQRSAPRE